MIGGGVTPEGIVQYQRFLPRTIDEDQWQSGRPRVCTWLWTRVRPDKRAATPEARKQAPKGESRSVNIIGPSSTACSTCRRTSRRSAVSSKAWGLRSTWSSRSAAISPMFASLIDAEVNICLYREFGRSLCEAMGRPYLQAPDRAAVHDSNSCATLGELTGLDPEPFIEPRKAHDHQGRCGICGGRSLRISSVRRSFGIVANETYARGIAKLPRTRLWACLAMFSFARVADTEARWRGHASRRSKENVAPCGFRQLQ